MFEYMINVAKRDGETWNGEPRYVHLFRTDWIDDQRKAREVQNSLLLAYSAQGEYKITVHKRSRIMEECVL